MKCICSTIFVKHLLCASHVGARDTAVNKIDNNSAYFLIGEMDENTLGKSNYRGCWRSAAAKRNSREGVSGGMARGKST